MARASKAVWAATFPQSTKATRAGTSAYVLNLSIKTRRRASLVLKRFAHLTDLLQQRGLSDEAALGSGIGRERATAPMWKQHRCAHE